MKGILISFMLFSMFICFWSLLRRIKVEKILYSSNSNRFIYKHVSFRASEYQNPKHIDQDDIDLPNQVEIFKKKYESVIITKIRFFNTKSANDFYFDEKMESEDGIFI
ncbi:hypothetical protein EDEG_01359 [Edhazardia aedis USNM 41457]|uniref:Uncharacterized protein n=1 Tax=Edhazardia aedis (strain USNM 41457) TaxID=1003232 RepID=J9DPD3_EDHAE|nr:hypothetical protein EDEG_01359 [Edhazardia aedis USNM 41457]|eukprot:EJW04405.1 hypothetical protein EDEG_01359 [Edhazardia aedis USNM 41457]